MTIIFPTLWYQFYLYPLPFYSVTVQETKPGSKLRRRMAVEASDREKAKEFLSEKCIPIGFVPNETTLKEITRKEYEKTISTLVGKFRRVLWKERLTLFPKLFMAGMTLTVK
jgi:hypothetical protein